jgi:Transposase IS4
MRPIPEVVPDPTDDGTLRPNIEPDPTTGDHFEPLKYPKFDPAVTLPPDVESDDPFGIWSLSFTPKIMDDIVRATNIRARHRVPVTSLSNRPAQTQLPGSCYRRWFDLTVWELYSYFAILIYMAITRLSSIELYWGSDYGKHKYVVLAMSCNRFQDITRNFCVINGDKSE